MLAIAAAACVAIPVSLLTISPAKAGWREDIGVFRIGIVARPGSGATIEGAAEIEKAFADVLGMRVGIYVARDYGDLVDAQASARVDYAIHTAASYATVSIQCGCVLPVAAPVSADGSDGIVSTLIARKGGPVNADDIPNYRIAFGPADSVTGALLPLVQLAPNKTPLTGAEPWLVHVESEADALAKLKAGDVDAMFGHSGTADEEVLAGSTLDMAQAAGVEEPAVLWRSRPLHNGPHAVRKSLPAEARELLEVFLTGLRDDDERVYDYLERRFGGGFAPTVEADFQSAVEMVGAMAGKAPGD
ncbi:MAG: PhnD/SsuA/transferrin family substrate-binding protein [Mesorhizobium sp.]